MLEDALVWLTDYINDARRTELFTLDGDRRGRKLVLNPDGGYTFIEPEPPLRRLTAHSIEALVEMALNPIDRRADYFDTPAIFYGYGYAQLIPNTKNPREIVQFNVTPSRQWLWLQELFQEREIQMTVAEAFDFFDTRMPGVAPEGFLAKIGKLKSTADSMREAARDEGSSLLGGIAAKKLDEQSQLANGDHTLKFLPYNADEPALYKAIPCNVRLRADLDGMLWRFLAIDEQVNAAVAAAADLIRDRILAVVARETADGSVAPQGLHVLRGSFGLHPRGEQA